jgi:hypothetical protein
MKKTAQNIFPLLFAVIVIFGSCSKDRLNEDTNNNKSNEYSSLDDFYDLNEPEEQEFVIDSIGGDTIVAQEGTKIYDVPKEIFMRKSDHSDITYPYTIKLVEAYSVKNKILSKLPGVAQGSMLYSGGNLRFRAFKDANELELKEHCGLPFMAPADNPDTSMELYYGFTTGTSDDWNSDVLQAGYLFPNDNVTQISTNSYGYQARTAKMGWLNISRKYSSSSQAVVTFEAEGTNTNFIDIYIIFNNLKSHIKVTNMQAINLPEGEPVTVFAIGKSAGQMYYYKDDFTTGAPLHIELLMQASSESQILSIMDGL